MGTFPQFVSGEWVGFYVYRNNPRRFLMDLILEFDHGHISGEGSDGIGPFGIDGNYHEGSGECSWIKTYFGRHSVAYTGFAEGKGIWGTWTIMRSAGGFHIWPIGHQPPLDSVEEEEPLAESDQVYPPIEVGAS